MDLKEYYKTLSKKIYSGREPDDNDWRMLRYLLFEKKNWGVVRKLKNMLLAELYSIKENKLSVEAAAVRELITEQYLAEIYGYEGSEKVCKVVLNRRHKPFSRE